MAIKKSWQEKLFDSKDLPKVVKLAPNAVRHWHGEMMVVPAPILVDKVMKKVPRGKLITIDGIRKELAKKFKTDITCPLTTGIFAWIAANAAEEAANEGKKDTTPWWRTLKSKGELNPKFPGGIDHQNTMLENEGHKIVQKGKKYFVEDFKGKLV
jgi:hypothetical protein